MYVACSQKYETNNFTYLVLQFFFSCLSKVVERIIFTVDIATVLLTAVSNEIRLGCHSNYRIFYNMAWFTEAVPILDNIFLHEISTVCVQ